MQLTKDNGPVVLSFLFCFSVCSAVSFISPIPFFLFLVRKSMALGLGDRTMAKTGGRCYHEFGTAWKIYKTTIYHHTIYNRTEKAWGQTDVLLLVVTIMMEVRTIIIKQPSYTNPPSVNRPTPSRCTPIHRLNPILPAILPASQGGMTGE